MTRSRTIPLLLFFGCGSIDALKIHNNKKIGSSVSSLLSSRSEQQDGKDFVHQQPTIKSVSSKLLVPQKKGRKLNKDFRASYYGTYYDDDKNNNNEHHTLNNDVDNSYYFDAEDAFTDEYDDTVEGDDGYYYYYYYYDDNNKVSGDIYYYYYDSKTEEENKINILPGTNLDSSTTPDDDDGYYYDTHSFDAYAYYYYDDEEIKKEEEEIEKEYLEKERFEEELKEEEEIKEIEKELEEEESKTEEEIEEGAEDLLNGWSSDSTATNIMNGPTCLKTCGKTIEDGLSCDAWVLFGYSCGYLELNQQCDCRGCMCNTPEFLAETDTDFDTLTITQINEQLQQHQQQQQYETNNNVNDVETMTAKDKIISLFTHISYISIVSILLIITCGLWIVKSTIWPYCCSPMFNNISDDEYFDKIKRRQTSSQLTTFDMDISNDNDLNDDDLHDTFPKQQKQKDFKNLF